MHGRAIRIESKNPRPPPAIEKKGGKKKGKKEKWSQMSQALEVGLKSKKTTKREETAKSHRITSL